MLTDRKQDLALLQKLLPEGPSLSFRYGGRLQRMPADDWQKSAAPLNGRILRRVYTTRIIELAVTVEYLVYTDAAAVEWTAWFENTGDAPTPVLTEVAALDICIPFRRLSTLNGDHCAADSFSPIEMTLSPGEKAVFAPEGGRPSCGAWPYQRWLGEDGGITLAVGWPGQWELTASGVEKGVHLLAGQQSFAVSLHPGERLRTPRITVQAFAGDEQRGINRWRRFYFDHLMPAVKGEPAKPFSVITEPGDGEEFTHSCEKLELQALEAMDKMPFGADLLWIDAGWYPSTLADGTMHWFYVGNWKADRLRYPNGFGKVGEACRKRDMGLLLWFEPERVTLESELAREHPDFLLGLNEAHAAFMANIREDYVTLSPDMPDFEEKMEAYDALLRPWGGLNLDTLTENRLLDMGNPAAREWITRRTADILREGDVTCFRIDLNFAPLYYWRDNEEEGRLGAVENHYVQGLLRFFDELREQVPGLFIDTCASGGRRLDSESIRRGLALHHSDHGYGVSPVQQAFRDAMNRWVPVYRGFMSSWDDANGEYPLRYMPAHIPEGRDAYDNYTFHNSMCPVITLGHPSQLTTHPNIPYLAKMEGIWRKAAAMMFEGDYYLLTPICRKGTGWTGYQFHLGDSGFVQVIRNTKCAQDSVPLRPHGMAGGRWLFENEETGESFTCEAKNTPVTFTLPPRQGALWFYRRVAE